MTWEQNNYLVHYGIKGQKHGVRRYQNDDGTLTAEGKARYGEMYDYGNSKTKGLIRRDAEKVHGVSRAFAEWREGRHIKNLGKKTIKYDKKLAKQKKALSELKKSGLKDAAQATDERIQKLEYKKNKKQQKYQGKLDAQSAANRNLEAYRNHSGTAKLLLRSARYEHARARGTSRAGAILESIDPTNIIRMRRDKKAYGRRIVYSLIDENDYKANAIEQD